MVDLSSLNWPLRKCEIGGCLLRPHLPRRARSVNPVSHACIIIDRSAAGLQQAVGVLTLLSLPNLFSCGHLVVCSGRNFTFLQYLLLQTSKCLKASSLGIQKKSDNTISHGLTCLIKMNQSQKNNRSATSYRNFTN